MYMTGSKLPLFPDMHIQMPVRVGYINIIKGLRSALRPYAEEATSKVEQIGYLCAPGLAILPLSSILEAANAGAMNPESLAIRWTRGLLPRAIREIAYGIGINELSDTMAEKRCSRNHNTSSWRRTRRWDVPVPPGRTQIASWSPIIQSNLRGLIPWAHLPLAIVLP